jgi:hypothetical protein
MKKTKFTILFIIMLCLTSLSSCLNDDNLGKVTFSGVSVTVTGDEVLGYKLYTDFDAILVPTSSSMAQLPWLKNVHRAIVSFNLTEKHEDVFQLETGKTYDIVLSSTSNWNSEIPTYIVCVDTLNTEYQEEGQDSIALKNKQINSFDKSEGNFYVKNGYMNVVPTFSYDPYKLVYFTLFYDGEKDLDVINKKLLLNLYFNNNVENPYNTISSVLSFKMSEEIYIKFLENGLNDNDSIDVYLKAETSSGYDQVHCKMALKDFMLP